MSCTPYIWPAPAAVIAQSPLAESTAGAAAWLERADWTQSNLIFVESGWKGLAESGVGW